MRETPLFLGLTKPPKIFGLPIGYFLSLVFASVIPFVLLDDMRWLLVLVVGYPPLWIVADRNPHLFQILNVTISKTPRTANHDENGGDRYVS
ncbi:type IV secretion system protein VirB3/type IV secretion system protein VirB4 [Palleronia aestuarii]|uniref:Type IV secretion system protein VirB3/type IV secretion system protein VirB4 n=1 Tax=Palleronia aestuarii TaxID=568105 RepID=A0A2W7N6G3_9RHOB|nr:MULTISPECIES: VirB3 family type IV secretion system protein [Palleronia]PZX12444.1 type IV secretion system protein VirB3/type IV secretion system protein VirB4 [Palleronia aestuarii]